jgi:catechol 2,3-dioxygenase-like lactoylglutathione lyase family enzyme
LEECAVIQVKGVAHFSIPVSDVKRSVDFYSKALGLTLIRADERHAFMDAGGICVLLCRETPPINKANNLDFVHHSFIVPHDQYSIVKDHLEEQGIEVLYVENLEGGTINGPRLYFRDPDGTRLEIIDLTSYNPSPVGASAPKSRQHQARQLPEG